MFGVRTAVISGFTASAMKRGIVMARLGVEVKARRMPMQCGAAKPQSDAGARERRMTQACLSLNCGDARSLADCCSGAGPIYEKIDTRFATARGNFDRLRPGGERASSLRVERTQYEIVETGSQRSALVTMSVVNEGTEPMSVPDVNIVVRGAGNTVLGETTASPSDADGGPLEAGASRDIAFEVPIDAGEVTSAELEFIAN